MLRPTPPTQDSPPLSRVNHGPRPRRRRPFYWVAALVLLFTLAISMSRSASAHNLNASVIYVYFDPDTQQMLDDRIASPSWTPPTPLLQIGDELGIVIKIIPDLGTTTGVGGYTTFYVPNGLQVLDAAYLLPGSNPADGITGWDKVPAKGQAPMPAVGAGGDSTVSLVGINRGPNILGVSSPIVTAGNANLGTLPGVYGDTGIFYSTAPETAFGSYTGAPQSIKNNSGDIVGLRTVLQRPLNLWDAWQLAAYGIAGTTNPAYPGAALVDSNQRGYAPWGLANVVAGPQSGYAWGFNYATYAACDPTPTTTPVANCIDQATQVMGPWQRIRYPGSQFADDPPGANPAVQPYTRGANAGSSGFFLSPSTPLPITTSQTDTTSPKAIRWAFGQLTYGRPEYAWLKVRVINPAALVDASGCPVWTVDTFGGDAGGSSGGKDHMWRYYDPNSVTFNGCLALGKPANKELVRVGDNFQYTIKLYNMGQHNLTSVVVRDTLPSGVTFVSAVPAANSGPNPLVWNVGTLLQGQKFEAVITVTAASSGLLNNTVSVTAVSNGVPISGTANETVVTGSQVLINQQKSVTPTSVAPGGAVDYTIRIDNIGTGPTGSPMVIEELLASGFTYEGPLLAATLNGASVSGVVTVNATNPNRPVFTVPGSINAANSLVLTFRARIAQTVAPGEYCNSYRATQNSIPLETGALACVNVGGGRIGDTIYRDWNGDGTQDPEDEGIAGLTVELRDGVCTPGSTCRTAVTDANGNYLFPGLTAGTYTVVVTNPPAGYTLTADPDGGTAHQATIVLATDQQRMDIDFGYRPGGVGSIGDRVFDDQGNDGLFDVGTDLGIPNVVVNLYEDTNGNGVVDPDDALIASDTTDASGIYGFSNLDPTRSYIVEAEDGPASPVDGYFADPYISTTGNPLTVGPADFTASGGNVTDADFGYFGLAPATIEGAVCTNADGDLDCDVADGDTFLPFVNVLLYKDVNGNGVLDAADILLQTTETGPDGTYQFSGVGPGDYVVVVDSTDPNVPDGYFPQSTGLPVDNLTAGETRSQIDFPFATLIEKSVSANAANPGDPLSFSINVNYPGDALLTNVTVSDPVPVGLNTIVPGQGGTVGPYAPIPGTPGLQLLLGDTVTVTLSPTQDTYISANDANRNFGTCTVLQTNRNGENALLQFNLSSIPANAIIDSAELILVKTGGDTDPFNVESYRVTTPWTEGTFCNANGTPNWNVPWTNTGGDWVDADGTAQGRATPYWTTEVSANGTYNWDMVQMVQEWRLGANNYGVLLETLETGGDKALVYASRENATVNNRPRLVVVYIETNSTGNEIGTSATTAATGATIQVTMQLTSTFNVANVMPSALTISGGAGSCVGPQEATPVTVQANVPKTLTWDCTLTGQGTYSFSGSATNGTTDFVTATSDSVLVTVNGSTQVISWNLGSNSEGVVGRNFTGGTLPGIFAFRGADKPDFWRYATTANTWAPMTSAPANIGTGGALVWDGSNLLYGLRGAGQKNLYAYSISGNSWSTLASLPVSVKDGGAMVKLGNFLYAFQGNKTTGFYRYDIAGNSWSAMAVTPAGVGKGAALVTDGTYIYGLQGNGQTRFWRYDPVANSWSAMATTPVQIGSGGALTRSGGFLYATQGNGKNGFYRYDIAANSWSARAVTPGNVSDGGALTNDGTYVYAFQGKTTTFWRYNIATNSWETRATVAAATGLGASLAFVPGTASIARTTTLSAASTLVGGGTQIEVTMALFSDVAVVNATPGTLSVTPTGGASVSPANCGSPTPASQNIGANTTVFYTWTCTANAGSVPGGLTFAAGASGDAGATTFASGTSNSVRVVPTLTFTGVVANPVTVQAVKNSAFIADGSGNLPPTASNPTYTALSASIGDFVWLDLDGDGVQDPGEPGIGGVEVCATDGVDTFCDVTAADGSYRIFGLDPGTWTVTPDPATYPTNYQPTTPTSVTAVITTPTQFFNTADFGLRPPGGGSIGDTVWTDADNDGIVDPDEDPLPGVTVRLYVDRNNDGIPDPDELIHVTTTDPDGQYLFDGLYADDYLVVVDTSSTVASPFDPAVTTTIAAGMAPTTGTTVIRPVTLPTDTSDVTNADFGFNWTGQIGDYVWFDNNVNGLQDEGGLTPIEGAEVRLYYDANDNGIVDPSEYFARAAVAYTDANGNYQFNNLPPGNYLVDPYEDSITRNGIRDIVPTTPNPLTVLLGPGESYQDADFGYYRGALVQGNVFWDEDRNGIFEPGEIGLAPVTVYLTPEPGVDLGNGPGVPISTETDANGHFQFQVPAGNYTLTYDGADVLALDPTLGDTTTPISYSFEALPGEDWQAVFNFGVDNSGSIGNRVWNDVDGDRVGPNGDGNAPGTDNSEPGLADVTVWLYRDNDNNGVLTPGDDFLTAQATDALGYYLFAGVPNGNYITIVDSSTVPAGFVQTHDNFGALNNTGKATVVGGSAVLTNDFGYRLPTTVVAVSGVVRNDSTLAPIAGATVTAVVDTDRDGIPDYVVTTTTGAGGAYSIPGIPPGSNVTVSVNPDTLGNPSYAPASDPDGTPDNQTVLTNITTNQTSVNFGYVQSPGSIGGRVCTGNFDGDCTDPGDTPLSGVTVTLRGAGPDGIIGTPDDTVATTTTNGSGVYTFPNLPPDQYVVEQTNLPGYLSLQDADGGNPDSIGIITLTPGQSVTGRDFVDALPAVIAGAVYDDLNGNGAQDPGEPGIPAVAVTLAGTNSYGAPVLLTALTDNTGAYLFEVFGGTYQVIETDPPALISTGSEPGTLGSSIVNDNILAVTLTNGQSSLNNDFLDAQPVPVSGTVVIDLDGDGQADPGEVGIAGVTITLIDRGPDGIYGTPDDVTVGTTTTNALGDYSFDDVPPGNYTILESDPPGYVSTGDADGPANGPNRIDLAVVSGVPTADQDFGDVLPGSISGTVFDDSNLNGQQGPLEGGIPNVTVTLIDPGPDGLYGTPDDVVVATTTTDANGNYSFPNVPPGDYIVVETDPAGYTSTTPNSVPVTVGNDEDVADVDFGDVSNNPLLGSIGGTVCAGSGNGTCDSGEPPLAGVVVTLYNNAGAPIRTTVTDALGNYLFDNLQPGTYRVEETNPLGYGSLNDADGLGNGPDRIDGLVITGATNLTDRDFEDTPLPGSLSGTVWEDLNGNGQFDPGEPPLAGATVTLYDGDGNPVGAPVVTGPNGQYSFTNLPPDDYTIVETNPAGHISTGDVDGANDDTIRVTLPAGGALTGLDFLDEAPGSISGSVWEDLDGDGIWDPNEDPLDGVTIVLLDEQGAPVAVTTTAPDGSYSFPSLPPGDYIVREIDPDGFTSTTPNTVPVTVGSGQDVTDVDFGDQMEIAARGAISGTVYNDLNGNGSWNAGEPGIPGVLVTLNNGQTRLTDVNGFYLFDNLPPGIYTVTETDPSGYTSTGDVAPPNDNSIPGIVINGNSVTNRDFFDQALPGSISGTVRDDGGNPLSGVTVRLYDSQGNLVGTTTTNASGAYSFPNLPPGKYTIIETDPPGYTSVSDVDGANDNTIVASVGPGQAVTGQDFVDEPFAVLAVGGVVWRDTGAGVNANNGTLDVGESVVSGVQVRLYRDNGDGVFNPATDTAVGTTTTNASGLYLFQNLAPGTYFAYIPPTMFQTGEPLHDGTFNAPLLSSTGTFTGDGRDHGVDQVSPNLAGIASTPIVLTVGGAPTGETEQPGGGLPDANADTTVYMGFRPSPPTAVALATQAVQTTQLWLPVVVLALGLISWTALRGRRRQIG